MGLEARGSLHHELRRRLTLNHSFVTRRSIGTPQLGLTNLQNFVKLKEKFVAYCSLFYFHSIGFESSKLMVLGIGN